MHIEAYKNILITTNLKILSAFIKFGVVLYITNMFGAADYGAYNFALTVFLFLNLLSRCGFDLYVQKMVAIYGESNNNASIKILLETTIFAGLSIFLVSLVVFGLLNAFGNSFDALRVDYLHLILYFSVLHPIFWITSYYYRGIKKGVFSVLNMELFFPSLQLCLMILLNGASFNVVETIIYSHGLSLLFCVLIYIFGIRQPLANYLKHKKLNAFQINLSHVKTSYPFMLVSMAWIILSWTDILILSFFESNTEIGIYSVIIKIGMVIMMPTSAVAIFFNNRVATLFKQRDFETLRELSQKLTLLLILLSAIGFVAINANGAWVLSFFGKEFADSTFLLLLFTFAQTINASAGVFESLFIMSDMKKMYLKINIGTIILNISLNIPLIFYYGIFGAAMATACSIIFGRLVQFLYLKRRFSNG